MLFRRKAAFLPFVPLLLVACSNRVERDRAAAGDPTSGDAAADAESGGDASVVAPPRELRQLPGDPAGPSPRAGHWVPMATPRWSVGPRVESGGTKIYAGRFLFRSVDGALPRPFNHPDMLRVPVTGSGYLTPRVTAAGDFLLTLSAKAGPQVFHATKSESAWSLVPCPPVGCAGIEQSGSGALLSPGATGPSGSTTNVLQRSLDRGATWTSEPLPIVTSSSCQWAAPPEGTHLLLGCGDALFLSLDDGKSFVTCATPPGTIKSYGLSSDSVVALGLRSAHVSTDGCKSWKTSWSSDGLLEGPFARGKRVFVSLQLLASSPRELLRSLDGGSTWSRLALPKDASPYWGPLVALGDGAHVFAGNVRSDDDGATWGPEVPTPSGVSALVLQSKGALGADGDLWAGSFLRTSDTGESWTSLTGGGSQPVFPDEKTGALFRLGPEIARSTDHGATWTTSSPKVGVPIAVRVGGGLIVGQIAEDGARGFWGAFVVSSDGGTTWTSVPTPNRVATGAFAISSSGTLYVVSGPGENEMAESVDGGRTWTRWKIDGQLSRRFAMNDVPDNPAYRLPAELLVTPSGELFAWAPDVIYRSKDGGRTWGEQLAAGLPSDRRDVLAYAPQGPQGTFFARGFHPSPDAWPMPEVYASIDGGASFHPYSEGLDPQSLDTVAYDLTGRAIAGTYAGTYRFEPK